MKTISDSVSLLLKDGSLFCGDAAMNGFPSKRKITIWAENKEDFLMSWKKIIALRPVLIFPGHGKPFSFHALERNLRYVKSMKTYALKA